jgi:V/A-type H+-transporting ATPase subunit C
MSISAIKYPSINAKLKGMYSKRLKNDDLQDLAKQNNLKSAVAILKNKSSSLNVLSEDADREQIEKVLNGEIIYDIEKIVKYLDKNDTQIFNLLISKYEIRCIKRAIKLLYSKNEYDENIKIWTNTIFTDLKGLESIKSIDEFLKIINNTKYKKILKKYFENKNTEYSIFEIENELDKMYLKSIYNSTGNNKNLKKMIGAKIDFTNILWIYRMKKYYNFSEDKIEKSIIDINYALKKNQILSLVKAKNIEELNEILKKTVYSNISTDDIYELECNMKKYLHGLYIKNFKSNLLSINCIYSYLNLVELENKDIISIIEAVRYGIDKEKLLKKLIN